MPRISECERKNRMTVKQAAELMEADQQFVRIALRQGVLPIGYAVKQKRWVYYITKSKFTEATGIIVPEAVFQRNSEGSSNGQAT